jgi:hypothetical protein
MADLKMVGVIGGRVPAQMNDLSETQGGTIHFTESAMDHQLNGQDSV